MKSKFFSVLFVFSAIFLAFGITVFAQGTTSRVTGIVTDSSGAVVPDANITLTNQGTNSSLTTQTSNGGVYVFDLVQPGTYTLTVEKTGFKKFVSTNNPVLVNQPATINVAMQIGDVSATVTVESSAETVQTSTSGNVGTTIDQATIESLPIVGTRGRNPLDLLNFQPGIVNGANTGGGVHVHGSRDRSFNFTLDGIDINESTAGGSNFTPLRPNPDSIQEFQVVTGNFTAELGRSSGAQVTFVTRSGTNQFRGNIFEYYQTPDFNANEYDLNLLGIRKRQFVQHIFGGSFGGPLFNPGFGEGTPMFNLLKDRAFFFVNVQILRAQETRLVQRTVYTQAARNGIFRYVQNGRNFPAGTAVPSVDFGGNQLFPNCPVVPATNPCIANYNIAANPTGVGIDPRLLQIINSMPLPNDFSAGDGLNTAGFNFAAPQIEKQYDFVSRFDFKVNDKNQFYIRYAQGEQNSFGDIVNGGLRAFPDTNNLVDTFRQPKNLAINYRWSPRANLTNEFIFGVSTFSFSFDTPNPDPTYTFSFNTIQNTNFNFNYNARSARTIQFVDNLTYIFGSHTLKGGINFRFGKQFDDRSGVAGTQIEPFASLALGAGNNNFAGFNLPTTGINTNDSTTLQNQINNFLGRVNTYSQGFVASPDGSSFLPGGSRWNFTAFYQEYDFYVQDTWKFRPNLTVDLGLRWELKLAPSSEGYPILRLNQPAGLAYPASSTLAWQEGRLFKNDLNNYSPSVGIAWDPWGNGKTSIRANYRLAYDRFATFLFGSSIFQSAPGNTTSVTTNGGLVRNLGTLFPSSTPNILRQPVSPSNSSITVIDEDLRFPEIHQWFVGFQRDISYNTVVEVNYIGRRGTHLLGGYDANQVNINATDPRCGSQTFLQAFVQAQDAAGAANPNCLASLLVGGAANGSSAAFRTAFLTQLNQNAVGTVAQTLAQRTGATAITGFGFSQFFFQKYPQFKGALNVLDSSDVSRYNGLEFIVKRRISNGIGFQIGYTYSISKDTRSFDPAFTVVSRGAVQSASSTPFDNNNRRLNYAWSDFDRRHALQATYVVELPFGRGRQFFSEMPKALDFIVGGWQLAGNVLLVSGRPFTVYSGFNTSSNSVSSLLNCNGCTRNMGKLIQNLGTNYFFTPEQIAMFTTPAAGEIGNVGRNFFIGPSQFQTDISLSKKFKFTERFAFDLRVDARNVTNTPSFANPNANLSSTAAPFGRIRESVVSGSRKIQFSGKFSF